MNSLIKKLRSIYIVNRLLAFIIKTLHISMLYAKWPVKGNIKFVIFNRTVKFFSNCDDYLISRYYYSGFDEEIYEIELLDSIIGHSGIFLDIGSYNGLFSIVLGKKYPDLKIYSFEPNPSNFTRTNHNISLNNLDNISVHNMGISNKNGILDFYVPKDLSLTTVSSFNSSFFDNHSNTPSIKKEVRVTSIDSFCNENGIYPQFIKIDVEGHEHEVFRGAQNIISTNKPIILCEIFTKKFDTYDDFQANQPNVYMINEFLTELKYGFYTLEEKALRQIDSLNINNDGRNFLFIPK